MRGVSLRLPIPPYITLILRGRQSLKSVCPESVGTCKSAVNLELEEWAKMMEALKHKASVPAEVMLLAASEETKNSVLLSDESGKDVPCDMCRLRHERVKDKY